MDAPFSLAKFIEGYSGQVRRSLKLSKPVISISTDTITSGEGDPQNDVSWHIRTFFSGCGNSRCCRTRMGRERQDQCGHCRAGRPRVQPLKYLFEAARGAGGWPL